MVRDRVRARRAVPSPHVWAHAQLEDFGLPQVREAVLFGHIIDWMPGRQRILFCARIKNDQGRLMWLHVVVDYTHPIRVGFVTAYRPDPAEWEEPPLQRRR